MRYNASKPYNSLPKLPPKIELETKEILKASILANRALAKLDGSIKQLPNPSVLIDTIGLQEAKASSEIENIITTHDELYQSAVADRKVEDSATKEVLFYKEALWYGYEQVKKRGIITSNLFVKLVQLLKQNQAGIRTLPGTQIKNDQTGEVVYTPPEGESIIRDKLSDLEQFILNCFNNSEFKYYELFDDFSKTIEIFFENIHGMMDELKTLLTFKFGIIKAI